MFFCAAQFPHVFAHILPLCLSLAGITLLATVGVGRPTAPETQPSGSALRSDAADAGGLSGTHTTTVSLQISVPLWSLAISQSRFPELYSPHFLATRRILVRADFEIPLESATPENVSGHEHGPLNAGLPSYTVISVFIFVLGLGLVGIRPARLNTIVIRSEIHAARGEII